MELKYFGTPPALRYIFYLIWRSLMLKLYEAHKTLVLWRKLLTATLAVVAWLASKKVSHSAGSCLVSDFIASA